MRSGEFGIESEGRRHDEPDDQQNGIDGLQAQSCNPDRGDSVNLMNAPFTRAPEAETVEVAWWKQPDTLDLARSMAWPAW